MKLFIILNHYTADVKRLEAKVVERMNGPSSYEDAKKIIDSDYSIIHQGIAAACQRILGKDRVEWVYGNIGAIQRMWLKSHVSADFTNLISLPEIVARQIEIHRPDIVLSFGLGPQFPNTFFRDLKSRWRSMRIWIWDGRFGPKFSSYSDIDGVFTCSKRIRDEYHSEGRTAMLLPFAFNNAVNDKIGQVQVRPVAVFSGSIMFSKDSHNFRLRLLGELSKCERFWAYCSIENTRNIATWASALKHGNVLNFRKLLTRNQSPLFGMEMFRLFASSLVTVNAHIDAAKENAGNLRLFEATGVGSCLVSDYKSDIGDYFEPDHEIVIYNSVEECVEKVSWLLDNEETARRIAEMGKAKVIRAHTVFHRATEVINCLKVVS